LRKLHNVTALLGIGLAPAADFLQGTKTAQTNFVIVQTAVSDARILRIDSGNIQVKLLSRVDVVFFNTEFNAAALLRKH
jgi:hypothetical protein